MAHTDALETACPDLRHKTSDAYHHVQKASPTSLHSMACLQFTSQVLESSTSDYRCMGRTCAPWLAAPVSELEWWRTAGTEGCCRAVEASPRRFSSANSPRSTWMISAKLGRSLASCATHPQWPTAQHMTIAHNDQPGRSSQGRRPPCIRSDGSDRFKVKVNPDRQRLLP